MNENHKIIAQECLDAAYKATMNFPEIVKTLIQNDFESYHIDYLRGTATYYLTNGENIEIEMPACAIPVADKFDLSAIQSAIKEAQTEAKGYTYKGFCEKVRSAGCAGYLVSFLGKRVIYLGRTAETHTEHFPR